jgi:hypothetical protein
MIEPENHAELFLVIFDEFGLFINISNFMGFVGSVRFFGYFYHLFLSGNREWQFVVCDDQAFRTEDCESLFSNIQSGREKFFISSKTRKEKEYLYGSMISFPPAVVRTGQSLESGENGTL